MNTTVLIAEDFEPFRRALSVMLEKKANLQIISEVDNGLQAVAKARELQPALILLDVGLPGLNGIRAARQIRDLSPNSRIIFVTQEASVEMAQEALNLGALGYVVKSDAGSELLPAIEAVLRGERFLSRTVDSAIASARITDPTACGETLKEKSGRSSPHEVLFYSHSHSFVDRAAGFLVPAIRAGHGALVLLTKSNREALLRRMRADGVEPDALTESGRYVSLDPSEFLSTFMKEGSPDRDRLMRVATNIFPMAARKSFDASHNCVAVCGECAPLLCSQGNARAAIRLEQLWSELGPRLNMHTLCVYPVGSFQGTLGTDVFGKICAEHSAVYPR